MMGHRGRSLGAGARDAWRRPRYYGLPVALGALVVALSVPMRRADAQLQITLTLSANPPTMTINGAAAAGTAPTSVASGITSYSLLGVWAVSPRITAQLTQAMPAGTTLEVNVSAPIGASSSGWVTLTTTAKNVVINLPLVAIGGLAIQYRFSATAAAGVIPLSTRIVKFDVLWS